MQLGFALVSEWFVLLRLDTSERSFKSLRCLLSTAADIAWLGCLQLTIGAVRAKSAKSVALKASTVHLQMLSEATRCPLRAASPANDHSGLRHHATRSSCMGMAAQRNLHNVGANVSLRVFRSDGDMQTRPRNTDVPCQDWLPA